jgi:hypothetical protein
MFQSRCFFDSDLLGNGDGDTADDAPGAVPSECGLFGCGTKSIDLAVNNKSNHATGWSVNNKLSC